MNETNLTAVSIFFGFILLAVAVYFSDFGVTAATYFSDVQSRQESAVQRYDKDTRHLYGLPKAETVIVEFSDYECPYCSVLHPTLKQIVDESDGTIAWEYRHLPLAGHANALGAALAAECVASLSSNEDFWSYTDTLFENQSQLNSFFLKTEALKLDISDSDFDDCVNSEETVALVQNDSATAQSLGGKGTPFSVVLHKDGSIQPVSGALPKENWQQILN